MKKILLSLGLIVMFSVYALEQRSTKVDPLITVTVPQASDSTSQTSSSSSSVILPRGVDNPTSQTPTPAASTPSSPAPSPAPTPAPQTGQYKDGQYTGNSADAFYGNIQVEAVIQNGKLADVKFLDYPHDRSTSVEINSEADPLLTSEALSAQSAQVDIVSGATLSSEAFVKSLQSALDQAGI